MTKKATTQDEYFNQSNYETKSTRGFFDLDPIAFNDVFGLNFTGTLLPTQIFAKDMIGLPHSTIVNISSMSAFNPLTKIPAYSAAKAAINNFTQWLAVHVAAGFFYGLPERPIKSISLENIKFTYAINPVADIPAMMSFLDPMTKQGLQFRHVDSVSINNVDIKGQDGEEILIENVNSYSKI